MATTLMAGVVTQEEAMQYARQFLNEHRLPGHRANLRLAPRATAVQTEQALRTNAYYVFNCGESQGYVIVSADDRTMPILGYTDSGTFDYSRIPDNMRHWLDDYAEQIRQLDLLGIQQETAAAQVATPEKTPVKPMISTVWAQHEPFNDLCPTDPLTGTTCLTGCVATAMAQVMYYHKYPAQTVERIPEYTTTNDSHIPVAGIDITPIDWANILPSYDGNDATPQQIQAVAQLMKLCGASVNMDYSSVSSSASTGSLLFSLTTYFDYDPSIQIIRRKNFNTEEWNRLVYDELAAGRPVIYRGTRDRKGNDSGHAFVIDGYDRNGYYHVNWGWGNYNGYFLLSVMDPYASTEREHYLSNEGYTINQEAVISILPNTHGAMPTPPKRLTTDGMAIIGADTLTRTSANSNFSDISLVVNTFNRAATTATFDLAVGVFNAKGEMVYVRTKQPYELPRNYGFTALKYSLSFGSGWPDGDYTIMSLSRESNENLDWLTDIGAERRAVYATLRGDTLILQSSTPKLEGTLSLEDQQLELGKLTKVTARVHNIGTPFSGMIYLYSDATRYGGRSVDMAAGEIKDIEMGFLPVFSGMQTLALVYEDAQNVEVPFAAFDVNVALPAKNLLEMKLVRRNATYDRTVSRYVVGPTLQLAINAKNVNDDVFNNKIVAKLYKLLEDGSNMGRQVQQKICDATIEPGQEKELEFTFDELINGGTYFVWIYFYSEGELDTEHRISGGTYLVDFASGIDTVENADETVEIYTLEGMKTGTAKRSQLKAGTAVQRRGVYIIDGRKVVK